MVERYCSRALITQTIVGYADPCGTSEEPDWEGYQQGPIRSFYGLPSHLEFDNGPVQSITSIETIDINNLETVYAADNYYLENYDEDRMPRVVFNYNAQPINSLRYRDAFKVTYVAGYGASATDVPADIRRAIVMLAGYLWGNRGACSDANKCMGECGAASKLNKFRIDSLVS